MLTFQILVSPLGSFFSSLMIKRYNAFKDAEHDDVQGQLFYIEEDVRNLTSFKTDAAYRACLTCLRHLGKITEHRSKGCIRIVLVQ